MWFDVLLLKRKFIKSFRTITTNSSNRTVLFSSIWIRLCAARSSSSPRRKRTTTSLHSAFFMLNSSFVVANSDLSVPIKLTRWTLSAEASDWMLVETIFGSNSSITSGIFPLFWYFFFIWIFWITEVYNELAVEHSLVIYFIYRKTHYRIFRIKPTSSLLAPTCTRTNFDALQTSNEK